MDRYMYIHIYIYISMYIFFSLMAGLVYSCSGVHPKTKKHIGLTLICVVLF